MPSSKAGSESTPSSSASSSFLIGTAAKRSLRKQLQAATDPAQTIQDFQKNNSVHTMFARAFNTTPIHELPLSHTTTRSKKSKLAKEEESNITPEPFQPQSVLQFLHHLGGKQSEIHKRIADALLRQLEIEISRTENKDALLKLLRSCWTPANSAVELRPVVIAVIRKLGEETPEAVLLRLSERDKNTSELLYGELIHLFDINIRRLIWESDWNRAVNNDEKDGLKNSLLYELLKVSFEDYASDQNLCTNANLLFVTSVAERRFLTQNRRVALATTVGSKTPEKPTTSSLAVAKIHEIIGDRPKLLNSLLALLISHHAQKSSGKSFLGGAENLTCTLLADILLSYRQLPRTFEHLIILATILDRSVKAGILHDDTIAQIQGCLRVLFRDTSNSKAPNANAATPNAPSKPTNAHAKNKKYSPDQDTEFIQKLLKKLTGAALVAMKQQDPQCLFLNPVNDEIAPGYSDIIKQPMCMKTMQDKQDDYKSLPEFENDVQLMFQNCITYNIGLDGQWFRNEARRQNRYWKENILTQARDNFRKEVAKRKKTWEKLQSSNEKTKEKQETSSSQAKTSNSTSKVSASKALAPFAKITTKEKGVLNLTAKDISPLPSTPKPASSKKRKKDGNSAASSNDLSYSNPTLALLPSLACMLLSDPFVLRLIIDKILRAMRVDILPNKSLPYSHLSIPGLLQILYLIQNTWFYCSSSGRFYVPASGVTIEEPKEKVTTDDKKAVLLLRTVLPLISKLSLDMKLDERFGTGGDLSNTEQDMDQSVYSASSVNDWNEYSQISSNQVNLAILAVLQAMMITITAPASTNEIILGKQLTRCMEILDLFYMHVTPQETFWLSFCKVVLKYKAKIPASIRDWVVALFMKYLEKEDRSCEETLFEIFLSLLIEWANFGNLVMPRDLLFTTCENAIEVISKAQNDDKYFPMSWCKGEARFIPIKKHFEKMLKSTPEAFSSSWKLKMGIDEKGLAEMKDKLKSRKSMDIDPAPVEEDSMDE